MDGDAYLQGLEAQIKALKEQHATMFGGTPPGDSPTVLSSTERARATAAPPPPPRPQPAAPQPHPVHDDLAARLQYHSGRLVHHLLQATQPAPIAPPPPPPREPIAPQPAHLASTAMAQCPVRELNGPNSVGRPKSRRTQPQGGKPRRGPSPAPAPGSPPAPATPERPPPPPPRGDQRTPEDDAFLRRLKAMRERHRRNMALLAWEGPAGRGAKPKAEAPVPIRAAVGSSPVYISGESDDEDGGRRPPIRSEAEIAAVLQGGDRSELLSRLNVAEPWEAAEAPAGQSESPHQSPVNDDATGSPIRGPFPFHFSPTRVPPKLCIPQPFSFERREAAKAKTIAQRRMEDDLMQRLLEEEGQRHRTFKANPVPPSTYLRLLDAKTIEAAKKHGTKIWAPDPPMVRPRSATPQPRRVPPELGGPPAPHDGPPAPAGPPRRRTSLPAPPAPAAGPEAVASAAATGDPSAPTPTAEAPEGGTKEAEAGRGSRTSSVQAVHGTASRRSASVPGGRRAAEVPAFPFQPHVNHSVPDWKKLWAKHEKQMVRARRKQQLTEAQEFHFTYQPRERAEPEDGVGPGKAAGAEEGRPEERRQSRCKSPRAGCPGPEDAPKATLASKLRNLETLRLLIQKEQHDLHRQREAAERRRHRKQVALRVVPHLPPDPNEARRLKAAEERLKNRIKHKEQILQYKQQLAETYRRLEQTRPFLFMRGEVERKKEEARETAKQNFREALRQEGLPADQIESIMAEDLDVLSDDGLEGPGGPLVDPLGLFARPPLGVATASGASAAAEGDMEATLQASEETVTAEEYGESFEASEAAASAAQATPTPDRADARSEGSARSAASRRTTTPSPHSSRSARSDRRRSASPASQRSRSTSSHKSTTSE